MKKLLLSLLIILSLLLSASTIGFASSSPEKLTKEQAKELWKQEKSKIDEIDQAISQISYQKLSKKTLSDTNVNIKVLNKHNVKSFTVNKDNKESFKNSMEKMKSLNIDIGSTQLPTNCNVYVYDFMYYPTEEPKSNIQKSDNVQALSQSDYVWQGHPMRLIWVNSMDMSTYYYQTSNEPLDKGGELVVNVAKKMVNMGFNRYVSGVWKPLGTAISLLGLDITVFDPSRTVLNYGNTYYFSGSGSYTKMFVQVLDTNNLYYGGGYIGFAATNKLDTSWSLVFHYFNTATQRADTKTGVVQRTYYPDCYMNDIYSYAWNNYLYKNGYYTYYLGDVTLETINGSRHYMSAQQYDVFDQAYGQ